MRLKSPFRIPGTTYTIRGVDDWLAFVTDRDGQWGYFHGEKLWCFWRQVDRAGINPCSANGVIAVAILAAQAGFAPDPIDPDCLADTVSHFGEGIRCEALDDDEEPRFLAGQRGQGNC